MELYIYISLYHVTIVSSILIFFPFFRSMRVTFVAQRLNCGRVLGVGCYVLACFVLISERNKDSFLSHSFFFFSFKDIEMYTFFFLKMILKYFNI